MSTENHTESVTDTLAVAILSARRHLQRLLARITTQPLALEIVSVIGAGVLHSICTLMVCTVLLAPSQRVCVRVLR